MQANKQTDERVAQYFSLYSWLFWTKVGKKRWEEGAKGGGARWRNEMERKRNRKEKEERRKERKERRQLVMRRKEAGGDA